MCIRLGWENRFLLRSGVFEFVASAFCHACPQIPKIREAK